MAHAGLRVLALDGGGTRGLSTLYMLREVMSGVSEDGGNLRPFEYFDLIAGSGLSGLCALLFVRFSYTIDQAIEFLQDLTQKLDDVEGLRQRVLQGSVDSVDDWLTCMTKWGRDPVVQLASLRQGIVQDAWSDVIKANIAGALERYPYMENGVFDFKNPSAETEAGRSKAFAVSSESQGYDENGGFSHARRYNVPLLSRTYDCRHGRTLYTLYAVGLATVASPAIMNPGVIFPEVLATGRHTTHNPVRLILEESNTLWPGLCVSGLVSIGAGPFAIDDGMMSPLSLPAAEACLRIYKENKELAGEVKRFVLPHDKQLARSYQRFETAAITGFAEYAQKDFLQAAVKESVSYSRGATKRATIAKILKDVKFPTTPEDSLALASLASLLRSLVLGGYASEAAIVTDVISNFILYESTASDDGSFRKAVLAAEAAKLECRAHCMYGKGHADELPDEIQSEGTRLLRIAVYGDPVEGDPRPPGGLQTLLDYAAGAYYALTVLRRGNPSEMQAPSCQALLREIWDLLGVPADMIQEPISKMGSLLDLVTVAALCEAATAQVLRGYRGLAYNGPLIRHAHRVLVDTPLTSVSYKILDAFANFFSICINLDTWSPSGDHSIVRLIDAGATKARENWSLINLAAERLALERRWQTQSPDLLSKCSALLKRHARSMSSSELLALSVENGHFGILRKVLREEASTLATAAVKGTSKFGDKGETLLHHAARLGFPYIMQTVIEYAGMATSKDLVDRPNNQGQTPLHLACLHRAPKELFHLLFVLGADVNSQCYQGRSALHYCFPDQSALPPVYDDIISLISENALPTIIPFDKPQIYSQGSRKTVDPRVYDSRVMANHLLNRHADISITNSEGETPLHTAARHGWGDNLDIFFRLQDDEAELLQITCLRLPDAAGLTVLDYTRKSKVRKGMDRGEDCITREMVKRGIVVPPANAYDLWNSRPQWVSVPLGRSKTPIQDEAVGTIPVPKPSPQPIARFLQPIVYQDPEFARPAESPPAASKGQPGLQQATTSWVPPRPPTYNDPPQVREAQRTALPVRPVSRGTEAQQKSGLFNKLRKSK